jgi:putative aldouronate transport system permease protein
MTLQQKIFGVFNTALLILLSLVCLAPIVNTIAISFSSPSSVAMGRVTFWPIGFNLTSYEFILTRPEFIQSLIVTLKRLVLGTVFQMLLILITAYPLSQERQHFSARTVYVWILVFTMLFGGGLIPFYLTVKNLRLLDTIWVFVITGVPVSNIILLLNFFRSIPREIPESGFLDGAGHLRILFSMYVPLSLSSLATLLLFTMVGHWNAWFDGMLYMNSPKNYPLATYLRTVIMSFDFTNVRSEDAYLLAEISNRTSKAAQIVVAMVPILLVYPFLQKYFVKGIVVGSVKG